MKLSETVKLFPTVFTVSCGPYMLLQNDDEHQAESFSGIYRLAAKYRRCFHYVVEHSEVPTSTRLGRIVFVSYPHG